jgi:hypothetical protein
MTTDRDILAAYTMGDYLYVKTTRYYEDTMKNHEVFLNGIDFSFQEYEAIPPGYPGNEDAEPETYFFERPVERNDGWRIYRFSYNGTFVIDPFTGFQIVETLPAIRNPWVYY